MQHRSSDASQRVETIPGIGIGATAIVATVADPTIFQSGRDFAAWIGLVPRQDSTGGKQKLGPISKQGDRYGVLVVGAIAVLRAPRRIPGSIPGSRNSWRGYIMSQAPGAPQQCRRALMDQPSCPGGRAIGRSERF